MILGQLQGYDRGALLADTTAGLTVGVMLIPQGMAYALIAGLPPIYGLYAGLVPLLVYSLLGTSRQLSAGPVAIVSLLVAAAIAPLAQGDPVRYAELALVLSMLTGVFLLALGVLRTGFLTNFLSLPVLGGFTSAAALIIGANQLKHLLGLPLSRSPHLFEILGEAIGVMGQSHLPTLAIGLSAIGLLLVLRSRTPRTPRALAVVALGTLLVWLLRLDTVGVEIVGTIPAGLPVFSLPRLETAPLRALIPTAIVIALVGFMQTIAIAKSIAIRRGYRLDPNQELIALGTANILGSLFQAYPTSGGFSRTVVNDQAGARTTVAGLIAAAVIAITLLALTPLFYFLPNAVLAAVIVVAVSNLIKPAEIRELWTVSRPDFAVFVITFTATLFLGIEEGILAGIAASILVAVCLAAFPSIVVHMVPESDGGVAVIRVNAPLFFANAPRVEDSIRELATQGGAELRTVILDAAPISRIDATGLHALLEVNAALRTDGKQLLLAGASPLVGAAVGRSRHLHTPPESAFFPSVSDAVAFALAHRDTNAPGSRG